MARFRSTCRLQNIFRKPSDNLFVHFYLLAKIRRYLRRVYLIHGYGYKFIVLLAFSFCTDKTESMRS